MRRLSSFLVAFALLGFSGSANADALTEMKQGEIWSHCESYFNDVERFRKRARHYMIKDRSLMFMESAKSLTPRNEKEAFLFVECVNLANGNAHRAHDQIRQNEAEDDKFFRLAETEATNNSNASQHDYLSKLDEKYQLDVETEAARQQFDASLEATRLSALKGVAMTFNIALAAVGAPGIGIDLGYNSAGGNPSSGSFGGVATSANQNHATHNSTQASAGAPPGDFSAAPVGPSVKSEEKNEPDEDAKIVTRKEPVKPVQEDSAPHAQQSCVAYRLSDDALVATVSNRCTFPVEWRWCWVPEGMGECRPDNLSGIIMPEGEVVVSGPEQGATRKAKSVVCDMTDADKFCRL